MPTRLEIVHRINVRVVMLAYHTDKRHQDPTQHHCKHSIEREGLWNRPYTSSQSFTSATFPVCKSVCRLDCSRFTSVATKVVLHPVHEPMTPSSHYRGLIQKSKCFCMDVPGSIDIPVMLRTAVLASPFPILQTQSRIFHTTTEHSWLDG